MKVLAILNELASDASRLYKENILSREYDNTALRSTFLYALNSNYTFWIRQIPEYEHESSELTLEKGIDALDNLMSRDVTGNAGIAFLADVLSKMDPDDAIVIERIIRRDLRCGVSDATVNKIWSGLIPEFKVMLADSKIQNIKFPAFAQTKLDGIRCHLKREGDSIMAYSRAGKYIELLNALDDAALKVMKDGETWDGELVCVENGQVMNRQKSNGILNKAICGTIRKDEAVTITFTAWDIVGSDDYHIRFTELQNRFEESYGIGSKFKLVHSTVVSSMEDAYAQFDDAIKQGEEGIILKNFLGAWEGKRSKNLCKMKGENTADLRVIRWEEGTGRNAGRLGNLICQTEDGLLEVSVGSGFSDADRDSITQNNVLDRILEVRYNQLIKSKTDKKPSLYLPRAVRFRDGEKATANMLEELV